MGERSSAPLRALPRAFVPGIPDPAPDTIDLPKEEYEKFHRVLRLGAGAQVAILPNDGRLLRCEFHGHSLTVLETTRPETESKQRITLALGLPKPDALESAIRMGSELGVARFLLFASERTVVRWDAKKRESRLNRLLSIAREASEVCFRTHMPKIEFAESLADILNSHPNALVLSEVEGVPQPFAPEGDAVIVIGPEGGWAPREVELIGDRARTLGPRVLRADTAAATAAALALCAR